MKHQIVKPTDIYSMYPQIFTVGGRGSGKTMINKTMINNMIYGKIRKQSINQTKN